MALVEASLRSERRTPPTPLRLRRLTLGLRQVDLAELSGVSREQIVRLEVEECSPTLRTAGKLANALRCDLTEIFPLNDERQATNLPSSKSRGQDPRHAEG